MNNSNHSSVALSVYCITILSAIAGLLLYHVYLYEPLLLSEAPQLTHRLAQFGCQIFIAAHMLLLYKVNRKRVNKADPPLEEEVG